jgi:hypothetical protein
MKCPSSTISGAVSYLLNGNGNAGRCLCGYYNGATVLVRGATMSEVKQPASVVLMADMTDSSNSNGYGDLNYESLA